MPDGKRVKREGAKPKMLPHVTGCYRMLLNVTETEEMTEQSQSENGQFVDRQSR